MKVSDRLDRLPLGSFHYQLLILSGLGWLFDSMDSGLASFVLARLKTEWSLSPDQIGLLGSAGLFGMFLGGALAGRLADRHGRRAMFQATLLIFSAATGLCALAWNAWSLLALRLLVGFGPGGELPVAATLVSEFAPARRTATLWILWFAMAYSYYGIFVWLPTLLVKQGYAEAQSFRFTLYITLAQIPGYFAASSGDLILWGCLVSFFNLGAWGVTYGYTPELYPTRLRGTGTGSAAAFGRIGGILTPLAVGGLMGAWGGGFHAVLVMFTGVMAAGALGVLLLGEETRGRTLEEISG